jgi:molecular chaperone DnaJ
MARREMDTYQPDHYRLLGVPAHATVDDVRNNYRKLSRIFHPDRQRGSEVAADCFKQIAAAYAELSDPLRRLNYDRTLMLKDPLRLVDDPRAERALDVLDRVVTRLRRKPAQLPGIVRGRDLRVQQPVPFAVAMQGGQVRVRALYQTTCSGCMGQGTSEPERNPICHVCQGHGQVRVGLRRLDQTCGFCHGRGAVIVAPCATCAGKGSAELAKDVAVDLPARCRDGAILRVRGAGETVASGGPAGDLVVVVHVEPHALLRAEGDDLLCDVPLTWSQAVAGAQVPVPTLDGQQWLSVPPGTPAGREFRIAGHGLPVPGTGRRGALRVRVLLDCPRPLLPAQIEAVRALEGLLGADAFRGVAEYLRLVEGLGVAPPATDPS